MHRHSMTTYVRATSCILSHIHYVNSDLCHYFLICDYSIFLSFRCTIYYPRTMSVYDLGVYVSFSFVSTLWRRFFVPFYFVSTLYPVLYLSVSTMDSIPSPPVSMLDSIASWFDLTLTKIPTVWVSCPPSAAPPGGETSRGVSPARGSEPTSRTQT